MDNTTSPPEACPFHVGPHQDEASFIAASDLFSTPLQKVINDDIGRGRPARREVQDCFGKVHNSIRAHYKESQRRSGLSIYPMIVASEVGNPSDPADNGRQGIGGVYTLFRSPSEIYKECPVHPLYELMKVANHLVLGVFVIVEPYLERDTVRRLRYLDDLTHFKTEMDVALKTLRSLKSAEEVNALFVETRYKTLTESVLQRSVDYCQSVIDAKRVDTDEFARYSEQIKPAVREGMSVATELQTKGVVSMLLRWKTMLSADEWRRLYVIIPTVWVTHMNNPREQLFRAVMDQTNVSTHIITAMNLNSIYEARLLVGRIVHDRMMSRCIFGTSDRWSRRKCQGLGSQTDSLGDYARDSILKYVEQWKGERAVPSKL